MKSRFPMSGWCGRVAPSARSLPLSILHKSPKSSRSVICVRCDNIHESARYKRNELHAMMTFCNIHCEKRGFALKIQPKFVADLGIPEWEMFLGDLDISRSDPAILVQLSRSSVRAARIWQEQGTLAPNWREQCSSQTAMALMFAVFVCMFAPHRRRMSRWTVFRAFQCHTD